MKKNWIKGAVKHPGALTEAAKEHGRSKVQEARIESHSDDPSIRSRGNLGLRFMGAAPHGNIGKKSVRKGKK